MHANGRGEPMDEAEACRLFGLAAAQGNAQAQSFLALMHANGRGGRKNEADYEAEVRRLYALAAVQGA